MSQQAAAENRTMRAGYFTLTLPPEYSLERHHSCEVENRNPWVDFGFSPPYLEPLPPVPEPARKPDSLPVEPLTQNPQNGLDSAAFSDLFPEPPETFWPPPPPPPRQPRFAPNSPRKRPIVLQDSWSWQGQGDHAIELIVWSPEPPGDGGPMQVVSQWTGHIGGVEVGVSETSQFMGLYQRVIVAHITLASPRCICLLYAKGLDREQFTAILESTEVHGNQIEARKTK